MALISFRDASIQSNSFGNGVVLSVEKNRALVGLVDSDYSGTGLSESEWAIYDEACWFRLTGISGFSTINVCLRTCLFVQVKNVALYCGNFNW